VGIGSGMVLGVVSRITSAMCGDGRLVHESYMTFWGSLITFLLAPLIFASFVFSSGKEVKYSMTAEQTIKLIEILTALLFLCLFKCVYLERDAMKRFVEDFNPDVHSLPEAVEEALSPTAKPEPKVTFNNEFSDDEGMQHEKKKSSPDIETESQKIERQYDEHAEFSKRNNINLSVLMLPIVYLIYVGFMVSGLDLQKEKQLKVDIFGSAITAGLVMVGLAVLTYCDDLLTGF